jgi:hypothetical protein
VKIMGIGILMVVVGSLIYKSRRRIHRALGIYRDRIMEKNNPIPDN